VETARRDLPPRSDRRDVAAFRLPRPRSARGRLPLPRCRASLQSDPRARNIGGGKTMGDAGALFRRRRRRNRRTVGHPSPHVRRETQNGKKFRRQKSSDRRPDNADGDVLLHVQRAGAVERDGGRHGRGPRRGNGPAPPSFAHPRKLVVSGLGESCLASGRAARHFSSAGGSALLLSVRHHQQSCEKGPEETDAAGRK